jgi:hypothetical protein
MTKSIELDELRKHLNHAKDRLSHEKLAILAINPLPQKFNREEYAFAYVRAERLGMGVINRRLAEIAWLPMQLDPKSEMLTDNRASMKRWLASALVDAPDSDTFGNDFIHALARTGFQCGWDSANFIRLSTRIANLFRDLSCLIGLIYYSTWLAENNVANVRLSNPDDLIRTAEEIAMLIQSPEILRYLRAQEQNDDKLAKKKKAVAKTPKKRTRPELRLIENHNFFDPYLPDPMTV